MLTYFSMRNISDRLVTKIILLLSVLLLLPSTELMSQDLKINEVMSSNISVIPDEDDDYPDWIELFNNDTAVVNTGNYFLSDDRSDLLKWRIPELQIEANRHLLLFASGKDRRTTVAHWETIINWGDTWKYFVGTSEPPADWKMTTFNDSSWLSGPSGFGYGDGDDSTIVPQTISLYIRKSFSIDNMNEIVSLLLHIDFDDGFVAYINGVEVARENIGIAGIVPLHNQTATSVTEAKIYRGLPPDQYLVDNFSNLLINGINTIAIQVHNQSINSSDLTIIPFLTLGLKNVPADPEGSPGILPLPLSYLHTNFKIDSGGETLYIADSTGNIADSLFTGDIPADISFGRKPDGETSWYFFDESTPGDSNITEGYSGICDSVRMSVPAGFYSDFIVLSLESSTPNSFITFTTDGSVPRESDQTYNSPLTINETTVLRARSFSQGLLPGKTSTSTYFVNFNSQLPVISISSDPDNFWDQDTGIYVLGNNASPNYPYFGANFWQDWERPIHIEFFEQNGTNAFRSDAGVKIFGGWSRAQPMKSLSVFFRSRYGSDRIEYRLFENRPFTSYKNFILRNSGNDWSYSMIRDAMMQRLVKDIDVETQAYKPAIVFINGEYWGIHNIREKINEHYLAGHFNVNKDSVIILENSGSPVLGDSTGYHEMIAYISNNSPAIQSNYEQVKSLIDIDQFINYQVSQIYFANVDWPGSNIKFWRPAQEGGKWRWIMFDTDFGFGLFNPGNYSHNTLDFATAVNGPSWPNPPWSTFLLRKLLLNEEFRTEFINRFADLSNSVFLSDTVISTINRMKTVISPEVFRHSSRWGNSLQNWESNIQRLYTFALNRLLYMRTHFVQKFGLTGLASLSININDPESGRIILNSLTINSHQWTGTYFRGIPVRLTAHPNYGYRFVKWEGSVNSTSPSITVIPQQNMVINAVFEANPFPNRTIVINEINYNSSAEFDPEDWIEFYNNSDSTYNISGWIFKDEDDSHEFIFPEGTILQPDEYIVVCRDTVKFTTLFPGVTNYLGNMSFGLSGGGELVRLYDNNMLIIDSLTYDDSDPWPSDPDGNGPTLSLINPDLDNSLPQSWSSSSGYGTPGSLNDNYSSVNEARLLPIAYKLNQNYPNPFNSRTILTFDLPQSSRVELKVFDVLGREVRTLISSTEMEAGTHSVYFDASGLASGIYLYRIKSEKFIDTKKMILLR